MAKKARKTASTTAGTGTTGPATPGARQKFVDIRQLRIMLTQLQTELLDDVTANGVTRKNTTALLRIGDLLLLLDCQQSMTRP